MPTPTPHTSTNPTHKLATGNTTVDKMRIVLHEHHQAQEEAERQAFLQQAMDRYLYHLLKNSQSCYNNPSEQPRLQKEVQTE